MAQSFPEYRPSSSAPGDESAGQDALIGTVLAGRYRIEQRLGSGGMGAVYRAEHVHMKKAVAVKVLHREMMAVPEVVARFEREAVAAARIEHPHVAAATDFGRLDSGACYLVLEFVEGRSLAKLLREQTRFAPERALGIARQIAEALAAAHAAGIVHRDLKPENVMLVTKDTETDFVKVLDFGIAKVNVEGANTEPALTQIGTVFGTPEYMSPEQARGYTVDTRSDLYTLGIILYEMLAGKSPFADPDLVVMLTRQLTAEPPPLPALGDPRIRELVQRLLQKNPDERFQTASELILHIDTLAGVYPAASGVATGASSGVLLRVGTALGTVKRSLGRGQAAEPGVRYSRRASDRKPPVWKLATLIALGSVFVAAIVLAVTLGLNSRHAALGAERAKPTDQEAELLRHAQAGDAAALSRLASKPEQERTLAEWRALGRGYMLLGQAALALAAYRSGVALEPELAKDTALLADVRRALELPEVSVDAASLAATALGPAGLDLLYDVWDSSRGSPSKAAVGKRARAYLEEDGARGRASPALDVLLDLLRAQRSEGCAAVKKLLPRVADLGDERVVPILHRFDERRGCGFLGLSDCYGCLRAGRDLLNAAKSAAARPAPAFKANPEIPAGK